MDKKGFTDGIMVWKGIVETQESTPSLAASDWCIIIVVINTGFGIVIGFIVVIAIIG